MTKEELEHVFDPYWRSQEQRSKKLNPFGNGIGLSICKDICDSLGGSISALSEPGTGSRFHFTMNVYRSNEGNSDEVPLNKSVLETIEEEVEEEDFPLASRIDEHQAKMYAGLVKFAGLTFDFNTDRINPVRIHRNRNIVLPKYKNLVNYLGVLQQSGLLSEKKNPGLVAYVDDQLIHQEQIKMHFRDIGISEKLLLFQDGLSLIEYLDVQFDGIEKD